MDLKAEQCWKRATCYKRTAEDESAPKEMRMRFAHQANLLRIMGKLAELDEERISENNIRAA